MPYDYMFQGIRLEKAESFVSKADERALEARTNRLRKLKCVTENHNGNQEEFRRKLFQELYLVVPGFLVGLPIASPLLALFVALFMLVLLIASPFILGEWISDWLDARSLRRARQQKKRSGEKPGIMNEHDV